MQRRSGTEALRVKLVRHLAGRLIAPFALIITLILALIISAGPSDAGSTAHVSPINNSSRQAVAESYRQHIDENLRLNANWNGTVNPCHAGSATTEFTTATLEAINWFRAMSGLPNVTHNSALGRNAQQTALMMHAANSLSHSPTTSWECHSTAGADTAGRSNLTLGTAGPRGVIGQVKDAGAGNESLGHRRWLLYPLLDAVGIGNTNRASAIQVIGDFATTRAGDEWIAWPPAGYVPHDMVFDRWSISYSGAATADFTNARVAVTLDGRAVATRILPQALGFGDPTLGWEITQRPNDVSADHTYIVTVSNVRIDGQNVSRTYEVESFDPSATGQTDSRPSSVPTCFGMPATALGTSGDDVIRGTAGPDVIISLGGNDTIYGEGGNDRICTGSGNDVVDGGRGTDRINGGAGRDRLSGSQGHDTLLGGGGRDLLIGRGGQDTCWARSSGSHGPFNDTIRGCEQGS